MYLFLLLISVFILNLQAARFIINIIILIKLVLSLYQLLYLYNLLLLFFYYCFVLSRTSNLNVVKPESPYLCSFVKKNTSYFKYKKRLFAFQKIKCYTKSFLCEYMIL